MKKPKKTYLVSDIECDIESDDDLQISSQSIVEAANKVLDFNALRKDQEKKLKDFKNKLKKKHFNDCQKDLSKIQKSKKNKKNISSK